MIRNRVWICFPVLLLACTLLSVAQQLSDVVPPLVNFSGILTDAAVKL